MSEFTSLNRRLANLCNGRMRKKIAEAISFANQFSIYNRTVVIPEYNTPMSYLLGLFYGLIKDDLELTQFLLGLAPSIDQLRSSYLKVWFRDNFNFEVEDVSQALTSITMLVNNGLLNVPSYIFDTFNGLGPKYEAMERCIKNRGIAVPSHIFDTFNGLGLNYEAMERCIKNRASRTV